MSWTKVLIAVLLAATGCDQAVTSATPTDRPSASATASAGPAAMELTVTDQPLPAGRYTRSAFTPRITLELDGTWHAVQLLDGFFDVQQDPGSPDVIAVQFARPTGVYGPDGTHVDAATAEATVDGLRANPALSVLGESPSRIGGLDGITIEVENISDSHAGVLFFQPGPLGIDPGRRLWISLFDTPDGLLAIMVGGSAARWDEALAEAEPVLESIRIGE